MRRPEIQREQTVRLWECSVDLPRGACTEAAAARVRVAFTVSAVTADDLLPGVSPSFTASALISPPCPQTQIR